MSENFVIDRIREAARTHAAYIPVHAVFGVRAVAGESGRAVFGQAMGPHLLDPRGRLCPGAFLVAADAALGSAIATDLELPKSVVSLTIHAQFVTLDPGSATDFLISAETVHLGERSGFSLGTIVDDHGRTVAHLSTHCGFTTAPRTFGPPSPVPAPGLEALPADHVELAPIAVHRAGAGVVDDGANGGITVTATSRADVRNSRGDLQGGVLGLLAEQAITACIVRGSPGLGDAMTAELDLCFVRAVRADHPEVTVTARSEHAGRRFAVARAEGRDGSGKLVVVASGSRYA